jgi:60 kDa SS-A/Ro ribonucleoprotein
MLAQWDLFKRRNPHAKLVCIDLQPNLTTQAHERGDILNVGGFSDAVFNVIAAFLRSGPGPRTWVDAISSMPL